MKPKLLIRNISEMPTDHYVSEQINISPIAIDSISRVEAIVEDVTSHSSTSPWKDMICNGLLIFLKSGQRFTMSQQIFNLALKGGGDFFVCYPNGEYSEPVTLAEYKDREARIARIEAEERFWDYY